MARRPNYGFEKRQKELERQKKKDAKTERKQQRKEEAARSEEAASMEAGEESNGSGAPSAADPGDLPPAASLH